MDFVTPAKLMKIEVVIDASANPPVTGKWKPADFQNDCSADGDFSGNEPVQKQGTAAILSSAPLGALIARIGGSTADQSIDTSATPNRVVFSIGRHCVFSVPTTPTGALYLGVNDTGPNMIRLTEALLVDVYEAL